MHLPSLNSRLRKRAVEERAMDESALSRLRIFEELRAVDAFRQALVLEEVPLEKLDDYHMMLR